MPIADNPLDKVADRLRGNWRQHQLGDVTGAGPVCLNGALMSVAGYLPCKCWDECTNVDHYTPSAEAAILRLYVYNALPDEDRGRALEDWNDAEGRSEEDVLLLVKHAAALWETACNGA